MGTISGLPSSSIITPATASSGSGSSTSSSSSSSSSGIFTGTSSYSQDLQNAVSRAVAIASLPINLLTNQQSALSNQSTELSSLDTDFTAVQSSIQAIQSALGGSGMKSTVSDPSIASVTVGDGATQGAYTINVSEVGAYATSLSSATWNSTADPSGGGTTYNLLVGGNTYIISPAGNSVSAVAAAINSQYGNLVQATAVNIGSAASPDYRISLQSATLGPMTLDLQAAPETELQLAQSDTTGYATSLSTNIWDSSGTPSFYTLAVDGTNYTINPTDNIAASVVAAINALSGSPVTATLVDVGASDPPDQRIQLQSNSAGVQNLNLTDAYGNSLQQQQTPVAAGATVSQTRWSWDPTADSSGDPTQYALTIGSVTQSFTTGDNTAQGVAAAINALSGSPVTASVIDVGTDDAPDYRIQLIDNTGSKTAAQLTRNTSFALQTQGQPPGELAQYEVANSGVTVTSDTRSVAIASGTTVTLLSKGTTDITVTQSISTLSTALSGFADAYNAAVAELAKQRGQTGGPLQGQSIVNQLSRALSSMSTYSSSDGRITMADLGFALNDDGTLTYSPLTMMGTDLMNPTGLVAFLGSTTSGGFLQAATGAMTSVEDSRTGLLKNQETAVQAQITSLINTIAQKQSDVEQLQTNLTNQMSKADAAIATMEQQYSYLTSMFAAQRTADLMYANE